MYQTGKSMKITVFHLTICIFMGILLSCSPNERIFYKDNIACSASKRGNKGWVYYSVEIGVPKQPYDKKPAIEMVIPGIGRLESNSLSVEDLKAKNSLKIREVYPTESTPQVGSWPKNVEKIMFNPYLSIVFDKQEILQIKMMHKGKFRKIDTDKWSELPCTESDIIEVFGKPDRTYEWFRE